MGDKITNQSDQSKFYLKSVHFITIQHKLSGALSNRQCIAMLHKLNTAQQKHVIQYKTNTHPDKPIDERTEVFEINMILVIIHLYPL